MNKRLGLDKKGQPAKRVIIALDPASGSWFAQEWNKTHKRYKAFAIGLPGFIKFETAEGLIEHIKGLGYRVRELKNLGSYK